MTEKGGIKDVGSSPEPSTFWCGLAWLDRVPLVRSTTAFSAATNLCGLQSVASSVTFLQPFLHLATDTVT